MAEDNQLRMSSDYREGQTYLVTFVEDSGADTATGTSSFTDLDRNTDNTNWFTFNITLPPGIVKGNL